jgi:hypothetical protein
MAQRSKCEGMQEKQKAMKQILQKPHCFSRLKRIEIHLLAVIKKPNCWFVFKTNLHPG